MAVLKQGRPVGAGFLVSGPGDTPLILTCAHVLADAGWTYQAWDDAIRIRFKAGGTRGTAQAVAAWYRDAATADVACLRLDAAPPPGAVTLPLAVAAGVEGVSSHYFGYPAGYDQGLRGEGRVLGLVPHDNQQRLQLRSEQVTSGFSGGPVWQPAQRRVIGIVLSGRQAATADGRLLYTAFAAPTETIRQIVPELRLAPAVGPDPGGALGQGLPADLRRALREVFLDCDEFYNRGDLRALFNTNRLKPLRSGLPEASSAKSLASQMIDYLSDLTLQDGSNSLVVFTIALAEEYGDARRDRLRDLAGQLQALKQRDDA